MAEVAIVQELLPHYRVPFFDGLRRTLAAEGVSLRLLHSRAAGARATHGDEATLPWAEIVPTNRVPLPGARHSLVYQRVAREVRTADLVVLEHANRHLTNYPLLALQRVGRSPAVALWGHGANLQSTRPRGPAESFKKVVGRQAAWWFAYTRGSADRVQAFGFPRGRVTVVNNSVDTSEYGESSRRQPFRCVFLGSLHEHKRVEFLLDAAAHIAATLPDFELKIIGDGPLRDVVEDAAAATSYVEHLGPLHGAAKAQVVASSTLMLNPGLVGLAIVESFAAGTPMVTIDEQFHSPELEYAEHGSNALVLPSDTDPAAFAAATASLLRSSAALVDLRRGCATAAETYSLPHMVENFAAGVLSCIRSLEPHGATERGRP